MAFIFRRWPVCWSSGSLIIMATFLSTGKLHVPRTAHAWIMVGRTNPFPSRTGDGTPKPSTSAPRRSLGTTNNNGPLSHLTVLHHENTGLSQRRTLLRRPLSQDRNDARSTTSTGDDDDTRSLSSTTTTTLPASSEAGGSAFELKKGDVITIDCKLVPHNDFVPEPLIDGVVLHPNDPPVQLALLLHCGNYLPGLHQAIQQNLKQIGDSVKELQLDAGWGARRDDLIATLSYKQIGITDSTQIKVGVELLLSNGMSCLVTNVTDTTFTIDANPPLAGASYVADVTLLQVENGPVQWITNNTTSDGGGGQYLLWSSDLLAQSRYDIATFALGCFWGGELEFMRTEGVIGTAVGYTQGLLPNPTYEQVCSGTTGHTEAILVVYNPQIVSYEQLVQLAMDRLGDNKYLINQVGNDRGTQYRHGIYYHTPKQQEIAHRIVESFGEDCQTECLPAENVFWLAEDYHQQYLLKGGQSARKNDPSVIRCYG